MDFMMVPRQAVGVVIGKGGDMIKRIQRDSGARVQFVQGTEDLSGDKLCQITGTMHQVRKAASMIRDLIQSVMMCGGGPGGGMPMGGGGGMHPGFGPGRPRMGGPGGGDGSPEIQFSVPANKCGLVIGRGGGAVRNINRQSGAHVEIARGAPPNPHKKIFIIRGDPHQIEHAKQLIMERVGGMGTSAGRERASLSAGGTYKCQSENSKEPPRKMRPVPTRESKEDVTVTEGEGLSPLHRAAMRGAVLRVRELIAGGADTRLRDRFGTTPLHRALLAAREEAADLLAEVDCSNDVQDKRGCTPLHWATFRGHVGVVRKLLAGGAWTRVRDGWGETPLHWALKYGKEAAAELILEADGDIDVPDTSGTTPLHLAAGSGFRGIVATLLYNDLNPHVRDCKGSYPIQLALWRLKHDDVPKMILSSYALKDIAVDMGELRLEAEDLRFCTEQLSLCYEQIRLMKGARVGASALSYHDLLTRHVSVVVPRLPRESIPDVVMQYGSERDFPHYADRISRRLRSAEERRVLMDRFQECFFLLPPELPPLPVTCTDVILKCLMRATDLEHFIRAVQIPPRK